MREGSRACIDPVGGSRAVFGLSGRVPGCVWVHRGKLCFGSSGGFQAEYRLRDGSRVVSRLPGESRVVFRVTGEGCVSVQVEVPSRSLGSEGSRQCFGSGRAWVVIWRSSELPDRSHSKRVLVYLYS